MKPDDDDTFSWWLLVLFLVGIILGIVLWCWWSDDGPGTASPATNTPYYNPLKGEDQP